MRTLNDYLAEQERGEALDEAFAEWCEDEGRDYTDPAARDEWEQEMGALAEANAEELAEQRRDAAMWD